MRKERFFEDRPSESPRTEFERDRDRILYSDAFQRLKGVTQVARVGETYTYHTRLTHSLKVAQVGRRLAQYLNRYYSNTSDGKSSVDTFIINPKVVAAASLAHDLGHPPFGHATESEIDNQIRRRGIDVGFEGNPQSFRIVTGVETNALYRDYPEKKGQGLNLTRASLNALIKYPWARGESIPDDYYYSSYNTSKKFGYYPAEKELFQWVRQDSPEYIRSTEAQLMDWADDVTYAVHDVIDFYQAGLIPLHEILQDTSEREEFIKHFENEYDNLPNSFQPSQFIEEDILERGLNETELKRSYKGTRDTDALIDRLRSQLIEDYLSVPDTVSLIPAKNSPYNQAKIEIDEQMRARVEFLKELTFYYVINNSALMGQQHGQRRIVTTLFDAFLAATDSGYDSEFGEYGGYENNMVLLPFRDDLVRADRRERRVRLIADAITSMTERQTIELYKRITGEGLGSLQNEIVR